MIGKAAFWPLLLAIKNAGHSAGVALSDCYLLFPFLFLAELIFDKRHDPAV